MDTFFFVKNYPRIRKFKTFFSPQFAVFHLFCFLGGEENEVQTVPSEIQAEGKETPNESISIFYKKPFFGPQGIYFLYLLAIG